MRQTVKKIQSSFDRAGTRKIETSPRKNLKGNAIGAKGQIKYNYRIIFN